MKVFLSYAKFDKEIATEIRKILENEKFEVFDGFPTIEPGKPITDTILKLIDSADLYVVIIPASEGDYTISPSVMAEIGYIRALVRKHPERRLIPIRTQNSAYQTFMIGEAEYIDWSHKFRNKDAKDQQQTPQNTHREMLVDALKAARHAFEMERHRQFEHITDPSIPTRIEMRLASAITLKDWALTHGFSVSDHVIQILNRAVIDKPPSEKMADDVDYALRELTAVTYPTTIETLDSTQTQAGMTFVRILGVLATIILIFAIFSYTNTDGPQANLWRSCLALSLGSLGALVFILYNIIGVLSDSAFSKDDIPGNILRVILGSIVGWIFFLSMGGNETPLEGKQQLILLAPFIAGYSTRLVVGVLEQAVQAIQLTLGLKDKMSDLSRRTKKAEQERRQIP